MRSMITTIYQDKQIQKLLENGGETYTRQQFNDIFMTKISRDNAATYLFASDGRLYGYNINYTNYDNDYKNTIEYRKSAQNNDKLSWVTTNHISIVSSLFPEDTKNRFGIVMIMKDFDSMNEVGMVVMTFKESDIFDVYNKLKITENSYEFIVDEDGNIVSHKDKLLLGKKAILYQGIKDKLYKSENGSFTTTINNEDCLVIFDTLNTTNWKLIYIIPRNELLKDIDLLKNIFLVIIALCSAVSIPIMLLISRSISKPIEDIKSLMIKFGEGDLSIKIHRYNDRTDEVGVLATEFNSMITQINSLIKNNYHNEIKKKEAEMEALQAQINPHFLYNTLDCINFTARKYKVKQICDMVLALGDLMRISIRKDRNMITVKEEIDYIQNYMTIQKIRYRDKLNLQINIDEALYDFIIPKLIIQPMIENAVVHGIEEKVGVGTIILNGYNDGKDVLFEIVDDGVGLDEELINNMLKINLLEYENLNNNGPIMESTNTDRKKGCSNIGLLNVDMRIKLVYGKNYGISVESRKNKGTKVTIRLPLKVTG